MMTEDTLVLETATDEPTPAAVGHEIGHCLGLRHTDYAVDPDASAAEMGTDSLIFWDGLG